MYNRLKLTDSHSLVKRCLTRGKNRRLLDGVNGSSPEVSSSAAADAVAAASSSTLTASSCFILSSSDAMMDGICLPFGGGGWLCLLVLCVQIVKRRMCFCFGWSCFGVLSILS